MSFAAIATLSLQARADGTLADYSAADQVFDEYRLDAHFPGIVYGVVADGRLVHVATFGVQDLESNHPVTADTLFRIASMTKAFTALTVLKLRDDGTAAPRCAGRGLRAGNAQLEIPHGRFAADSRARSLNHTGGFVTDDPWGDRQTPLPEAEFTELLRNGVPFSSAPTTRYEYSNLGFAILGRIITNVSGKPFATTITRSLLQPLGMAASGFDVEAAPQAQRALGYRWEDDAWRLEQTLGPGAFGAMGGLQTSANDYAKWVAFLLSAWPPRDGKDEGPVQRATIRELAQGSNFPQAWDRPARPGSAASRQSVTYGMGMFIATDETLGLNISHTGGYPGFGSAVLLFPDRGIGLFAFANRTYASADLPLWDAAIALDGKGLLGTERSLSASASLDAAYLVAGATYEAGSIEAARELLAMNFLLDRDADAWSRELARLKAETGACDTTTPIKATGTLSGEFTWRCAHGRISGLLLLAPTQPALIQALHLSRIDP